MRTALLTTLAAAVLATSAGPTLAAPGDLDPSFNGNGKLVFSPAGRAGSVRAVAIQPDGKIILAGSVVDPVDNKHDIAVTRLNVDGTVDQGFGTGGTAIADYRSGQDHTDVTGTAVALQADNKIVVAGTLTVNNNSP